MYSETEMKEFFQNIIDQVATLSSQAAKVDGLEQRILNMSDRLRDLEETNRNLQQQVHEVNSKLVHTEDQLNATRRDYESEMAVTRNLRDVITGRDSKVQEVESNLETERDAHKITLSERDDARRAAGEFEQKVHSFRDELDRTQVDLQEWRDRAYKAEAQVTDYKQQLDKINSLLNPLRVVSQDVASG